MSSDPQHKCAHLRGRIVALFHAILVAVSFSNAAAGEELEQFRARIAAAFSADDKKTAVRELFYLEGSDAEIIAMYNDRTIPMLVRRAPAEITFEDLPADFQAIYVLQGYEYRPNLQLAGLVVMDGKMRVPYGAVNDRFYFTGMSRELVDPSPPPEVTLQVNVFGFSSPPIRFSASCEILQSNGKTRHYTLEDTGIGNTTFMVNAVRVESCNAEKKSGDGALTLRIIEDGELTFEQSEARAGTALEYRR